jgi:mono/diheme cytochrome c family protein
VEKPAGWPFWDYSDMREQQKPMHKLSMKSDHYCQQRSFSLLLVLALFGTALNGAEEKRASNPSRELFIKVCAPCHSADGRAQTPAAKKLGVHDLSESKLTDAQIIQQVMAGRLDNQKTTKMPAFKDKLTQAEIESLVPVVKGFRK